MIARGTWPRCARYIETAPKEGAELLCGGLDAPALLAAREEGQLRLPTVFADVRQPHADRAGRDLRPGRLPDPVRRRGRRDRAWPTTSPTACRATCSARTSAARTAWPPAIEAGMCFVNSQNVRDLRQPFGGTKASGTGREGGPGATRCSASRRTSAVSLGDRTFRTGASDRPQNLGKLALAAKITHVPSIYLSELPGARQGTRQDAIDGHIEIGRRCRELGVDTIVVFDTHWLVNANYHVNCGAALPGPVHQQRAAALHQQHGLRVPGQPGAGQAAGGSVQRFGVETLAHDRTTLAPEYGTLVPMRYMNTDQHFKVVSVSALCQAHYLNDSARLGWAMRRAVEDTTTAPSPSSPAARCRTASRRTGWRAGVRVQDLEPLPGSAGPRGGAHVAGGRMAVVLRHAARVRGQGPRRGLHARHRDAAGRAGLVGVRGQGGGGHALLRRLRHRADQRRVPGHAGEGRRDPEARGLLEPRATPTSTSASEHAAPCVILYTPNIEGKSDVGALCRTLADEMLTILDEGAQVFPPAAPACWPIRPRITRWPTARATTPSSTSTCAWAAAAATR